MDNEKLAKEIFEDIRESLRLIAEDYETDDLGNSREIILWMPSCIDIDGDQYSYHELFDD